MKCISIFGTLLFLMHLGSAACAAKIRLADTELMRITGQSIPRELHPEFQPDEVAFRPDSYIQSSGTATTNGPRLTIQFDVTHEVSWDVLAYGDTDAGDTAYASISDVRYRMHFSTPPGGGVVSTATFSPHILKPDGPAVHKLRLELTRIRVGLEEAVIQAIQIGEKPGKGKSFGSLTLSGGITELSGNIEIWPH